MGNLPVWSEYNFRNSLVVRMVAKTTCERVLLVSCEGLTSSEVLMSKSVVSVVERMFFCCMRRWPLLVARDLVRCFVMRDVVNPGHVVKCPFLIARRKVDGCGLKAQACS